LCCRPTTSGHLDPGNPDDVATATSSDGVVVVGGSHDRGYYPENRENIPGIVRGYDARTGRMLWRFDPVPKPGQPFNDTWEEGSLRYTGNVSPWAPLSADSKLGLVYIPTDTPTSRWRG
jgi:quinoprotein glucose dehydrogenase